MANDGIHNMAQMRYNRSCGYSFSLFYTIASASGKKKLKSPYAWDRWKCAEEKNPMKMKGKMGMMMNKMGPYTKERRMGKMR